MDTSAVIAIALKERDAEYFAETIAAQRCLIATPTLLEIHLVLKPHGDPQALATFETILARPQITVVDFTRAHFDAAARAFNEFGKGRHPAKLNFGDCMAYAVAKANDVPLLYKGDDFAQTDIRAAVS